MKTSASESDSQNRILTIPNVLSLIRLLMIPAILYFSIAKEQYLVSAVLVVVSGATDVVDGIIARHFHMTSNVGKILDPTADKLTQLAALACLCFRYTRLLIPLCVLVVKELVNGIIALVMLHYHHKPLNSKWHGKVTTVLLYGMIFAHFIWEDIPKWISILMISVCLGLMILSFVLYTIRNIRIIRSEKEQLESVAANNQSGPSETESES